MPLPPTTKVTCDASSTPGVCLHDRAVLLDGKASRRVKALALGLSLGDDSLELLLQLLRRCILDIEGPKTERGEGQQPTVGADANAGHAERGQRDGGVDPATETGDRALDYSSILVHTA